MDQSRAIVHRICRDRIVNRGDSHQTLRVDTSGARSHEEVLWMFINNTEDLTPAEVDAVIDMKIGESLAEAVRRAVAGIVKVLGLPFPSEEKIAEGLNAIERYTPELRKPDERRNKGDPTLYYALLLELDLFEYLDNILSSVDHIAEELQQAWGLLKSGNRVTKHPHVMIIHKNNVDINRALWNRCAALHGDAVN
jgi:tRNA ligase